MFEQKKKTDFDTFINLITHEQLHWVCLELIYYIIIIIYFTQIVCTLVKTHSRVTTHLIEISSHRHGSYNNIITINY